MSKFTGRQNTGKTKSFFSAIGEIMDAMSDSGHLERISEIDDQIEELQQERDHEIASMSNPGTLRVSKNYNPRWSKDDTTTTVDESFGSDGRLTECEGQHYVSPYSRVHPGCPYRDRIHNDHEFTLRD